MELSRADRSKRDVDHHQIIANEYERVVNEPRAIANSALFRAVKGFLPKARSKMLDIGCGTGKMTARFGPHFHSITAVDHSNAMLNVARGKLKQKGFFSRIKFIHCDAFQFSSSDNDNYDFICAVGFLHHLAPSDLEEILNRLVSRLANSGTLVMAEPFEFDPMKEPKLAIWWNKPFRQNFTGYSVNAVEPEEAPINEHFFEQTFEKVGLKILYKRRAWELFPRFGNFMDNIFIPLLDIFTKKDGVVGLYVVSKI